MKSALALFLVFFFSYLAKGQLIIKLYEDTAYIQRLEDQHAHAPNDSIRAYTAFKLSYSYKRAKNPTKTKEYLQKGLSLSKDNSFLRGAGFYYQAFAGLGEEDLAVIKGHILKADSILSGYHQHEALRLRSGCWTLRGVLEQLTGNEKKGLDAYINHALPLAKQSGNSLAIAASNKFVGISLLNAEERQKANEYLKNSLANFEKVTDESMALKEEAIVEVLLILAENNIFINKLDEGKVYLDQASTILNKYPNTNAFLFYYVPEGQYYEKKNQFRQAIESYDKGIALQQGVGENYYINRAKYCKFNILQKIDRHREAIVVMKDLLKSNIILPHDRNSYYNLLAQSYAKTGNMTEAYNWSQKHITIKDSLSTTQNKADIIEMEKKYQTAEKEKQIIQLQNEKKQAELAEKNHRLLQWLFGVSAAICLLALIFATYIYRNRQQKITSELEELEKQRQLDLTQAILEDEERERQRIARDLHDGLGGTLSGIKIKLSSEQQYTTIPVINESIQQLEASIGELRRIARNMMPETLIRSGLEVALRDLCVSLYSDSTAIEFQSNGIRKDMPLQVQVNIYRIIQELLANAIRHGKASKIIVQCIFNHHNFLITVEDNGKGFDTTYRLPTSGIGLDNIQNRVDLMKGRMDIESCIDDGTTVHIELHII